MLNCGFASLKAEQLSPIYVLDLRILSLRMFCQVYGRLLSRV